MRELSGVFGCGVVAVSVVSTEWSLAEVGEGVESLVSGGADLAFLFGVGRLRFLLDPLGGDSVSGSEDSSELLVELLLDWVDGLSVLRFLEDLCAVFLRLLERERVLGIMVVLEGMRGVIISLYVS